jgi:hypothetical protein
MTGEGGGVILSTARRVLQREFPEVEEGLRLHMPSEKEKRLGQAVAAATLPRITAPSGRGSDTAGLTSSG